MAKRNARTVNGFYLVSLGLWTLGAIVVTQYFNSGFGLASYALVGLSLLAALAGMFIKSHRVSLSVARMELSVAAVIFVVLAVLTVGFWLLALHFNLAMYP